MSIIDPKDTLERQNEKLWKISQALMRKVEKNTADSNIAYHQFERAALLETDVQQRTRDLEKTLNLLHESNAQLEAARSEAETARSNLAEAIETIEEGFALFDENDRLVLFNSRFCRDLKDVKPLLQAGLAFQRYVDLISHSADLALPADQSRQDWAALRHRNHREEHVVFNVSLTEDRWLQASEHRTSRSGTVILQTDITEIMRVERLERDKMRQNEAVKLQATLDHLNQGVCIFDSNKMLIGSNKRMGQLLESIPSKGKRPKSFDDLFDHLTSELLFESGYSANQFMRWVNSSEIRSPIAFEVTAGAERIYSLFAQEMPGRGFVVSLTDVTAERTASHKLAEINEKLEELVIARTSELEEALQEAERANSSKSRFVAAASHDLLQPLSAAKLFVSSISDKTGNDDIKQIVAKTETALNSVEHLIEALLDISKLDASRADFNIQPIKLTDVINPLRDEFKQIAQAKGLEFRFVHSGLSVVSDPGYLRRIVQNLLSNAVRYTQSGRVLAGIRRAGSFARIEVWDTGCGIAKEDQNEIFREFNQINTGQPNAGLGLGLAIVERACKRLELPLEVWSEQGVGSCFSVLVPISSAAGTPTKGDRRDTAQTETGLNGALVMVVENNPNVAQAICDLVDGYGGEVILANTAQEALEILSEVDLAPEALLLDYQLGPGLDGIALYEAVLQRHGMVSAAILSADRSIELRERCRALNLPLIPKPLMPARIYRFLDAVTGS